MRIVRIGFSISLLISIICSGAYASDDLSSYMGTTTYGGLSGGTPGAANANMFINPNMGTNGSIGLGVSISLLTVLMNGQDESGENNYDDDIYTAMQLSLPWYLVSRENYFMALAPCAGFGYYHPGGKPKGHWYYAGGAVDLYLWGLFIECGAGYGPRHGIKGVRLAKRTSLLVSVGFLGRGVSW
jgi:hypothetical protein